MALGRHAWSSGKRIKGREQCHEMPGPASHRKGRGKWQQSVGPLWGACSLVAPCEKLKVGLGRDPTKERGALLGGVSLVLICPPEANPRHRNSGKLMLRRNGVGSRLAPVST